MSPAAQMSRQFLVVGRVAELAVINVILFQVRRRSTPLSTSITSIRPLMSAMVGRKKVCRCKPSGYSRSGG